MERRPPVSLFVLIAIALILALTGCGPREASSDATHVAEPAPSSTAEESPAPPPATPQETAAEADPETVEETPYKPDDVPPVQRSAPDDLISRSTRSLDDLSSYRYSALVRFEWTDKETVQSNSIEITGEFVFPNREHITWTNTDFGERFEVVRIYDSAWLFEDGEWTKMPALAIEGIMRAVILFAPAYAWESLASELETTSSFVGNEVVNGISALHYASNYAGWEERFDGSLHTGRGDIWVAEEGFPVRCVFTGTGTDEEGRPGAIEWRMEIMDVNQSISIEPPGA